MAVWMPIMESDKGPPGPEVTAPLDDPRVTWYWDQDRLLMDPMVQRTRALHEAGRVVPNLGPGDLLWDVITAYDPGVVWEDPFPSPTWFGMEMVLHSIPFVERRLKELSDS